ncbi:MAG: SdpI family protein [Candidatus Acidiferrales bacterium]
MTRARYVVAIALVAGALIVTIVAYPHLGNSIPVHVNFHGQIDRYGPRWMLFLLGPGVMLGMVVLFAVLPWLSPKHFEVDAFRSTCARIMLIVVAMFGYFYGVMVWAALGHTANLARATFGGVCLLVALLGNLMGKVRRNFYIGVRTPWTLANERVWSGTHRFAGKSFVAGGLLGLGLALAGFAGWPAIVALGTGLLAPVAYSLVFYKKLERRGEL